MVLLRNIKTCVQSPNDSKVRSLSCIKAQLQSSVTLVFCKNDSCQLILVMCHTIYYHTIVPGNQETQRHVFSLPRSPGPYGILEQLKLNRHFSGAWMSVRAPLLTRGHLETLDPGAFWIHHWVNMEAKHCPFMKMEYQYLISHTADPQKWCWEIDCTWCNKLHRSHSVQ